MSHLSLLGRTLRRTLPRLAAVIYILVLAALSAAPVTAPTAAACAGSALLLVLLVGAELRLVQTGDTVERLHQRIGDLRAELAESYTDPVTGLPVRRIAEGRLTRACAAGEPVTVALIDVDDMHGVNDVHGHRGGDAYLAGIAWLLTDLAGNDGSDTVARLGGDEFILISTRTPHTVAAELAALVSPTVIPVGDSSVPVRFSAGVHRTGGTGGTSGASGSGGGELHTVLGCADLAMYTAKRHGGGVLVYDARRDGAPPAGGVRPRPRSRNRSSALSSDPVTSPPPSRMPAAAAPSGRHARAVPAGPVAPAASTELAPAALVPTAPAVVPRCWQCRTPSPLVPGGVRRCPQCGAGLVFDAADGWISPAEQLHRRRAETTAQQIAASVQQVAEALPALAGSAPAGWSITAAVPAVDGALHGVAVRPPIGTVDATAYLTPDTGRGGTTAWTVRVHNRSQRIDYPLYTDGGAHAARFRTPVDAFAAAVRALRIEIAEETRR